MQCSVETQTERIERVDTFTNTKINIFIDFEKK